MYKRCVALISDLHVGSRYAIFPRGIKTDEGNEIKINKGQAKLLEYWADFWRIADEMKADTVIDLADDTEGNNVKEFGSGLMCDLDLQRDACTALLKPHVQNRQYFCITGSGYHQSKELRIQKNIAKELGGKFLGPMANLKLKGTSRTLNIAHGEGGAMVYRATAMDREGLFQLAAQALGKIPKADMVIRGHLHSFLELHLANQHVVQLPCWKAFDGSKISLKSYGKMQPDIGACLLLIDEADRMNLWHYLYPTPHIGDCLRTV